MVALVFSTLITIVMSVGLLQYGKRRKEGTPLTWGEAMVGGTYVFFLAFVAYGVVPHQWLTLAENEWAWRGDRFVYGPGNIFQPISKGGHMPFDITYRTVSDSVAVLIYGVYIGAQILLFALWQNRGANADKKAKAALEQKSSFGRPLIRQG